MLFSFFFFKGAWTGNFQKLKKLDEYGPSNMVAIYEQLVNATSMFISLWKINLWWRKWNTCPTKTYFLFLLVYMYYNVDSGQVCRWANTILFTHCLAIIIVFASKVLAVCPSGVTHVENWNQITWDITSLFAVGSSISGGILLLLWRVISEYESMSKYAYMHFDLHKFQPDTRGQVRNNSRD